MSKNATHTDWADLDLTDSDHSGNEGSEVAESIGYGDVVYTDRAHINADILTPKLIEDLGKHGIKIPEEYIQWYRVFDTVDNSALGVNTLILNYLTPQDPKKKQEVLAALGGFRSILVQHDGIDYTVISTGLSWLTEYKLSDLSKKRIASGFTEESIVLEEAKEGINVRAWHDGTKWNYSTHRKLGTNSRWACPYTVGDIMEQLQLEDLMTEADTDLIYWFLVRHEEMQTMGKSSTEILQVRPTSEHSIIPGLQRPTSYSFQVDWTRPSNKLKRALRSHQCLVVRHVNDDGSETSIAKLCTVEYIENLAIWGNERSVYYGYLQLYTNKHLRRKFKVLTDLRYEEDLRRAKSDMKLLVEIVRIQTEDCIRNNNLNTRPHSSIGTLVSRLLNWYRRDVLNNLITPRVIIEYLGKCTVAERMKMLQNAKRREERGQFTPHVRQQYDHPNKFRDDRGARGTTRQKGFYRAKSGPPVDRRSSETTDFVRGNSNPRRNRNVGSVATFRVASQGRRNQNEYNTQRKKRIVRNTSALSDSESAHEEVEDLNLSEDESKIEKPDKLRKKKKSKSKKVKTVPSEEESDEKVSETKKTRKKHHKKVNKMTEEELSENDFEEGKTRDEEECNDEEHHSEE